jgi:type I restriction enzyme M protein
MLDTTTKKRIDDCRDILVGKLPDPKAQIEQITIGLIYKFMDDMDKEAVELGGSAKYFSGDYEKYAWDKLFDTKVTAAEMLSLYSEAIVSMEKNPNIPQLFRDIFKNAYLPYRSAETLKLFLKTIGEFEYTHSEKLGDAFEYLLSVMGSQGDAGQFRTPRHIIDFLVAIIDPDKGETILDPACGTAGFLISAYKHILLKHTKANQISIDSNSVRTLHATSQQATSQQATSPQYNIFTYNQLEKKPFNNLGDQLTPDDRKKLIRNFAGYDISPDMVRLSLVNLYLHGFPNPEIYEYDTLSSEDRWNENFDVVLANPPFMSPKGGIRPHKKFTISSNRSEVLFVDYIAEHLNPKGKAGIIVPEGVIFQSGKAYKGLRKMLVENYLYAVVSLPAGVFNPYSGVKTSILLMDKAIAKQRNEILFVKIDNDGYNLGAQRTAVKGSQLEEAIKIIHDFVAAGTLHATSLQQTTIAHIVPKTEIAANGDYNLSGERYRINEILVGDNFRKLGDICDFKRGPFGGSLKKEIFVEDGIAVYEQNHAIYNQFDDFRYFISDEKFQEMQGFEVQPNDIIMSCSGTMGKVAIVPKTAPKGIINQALLKLSTTDEILPIYLKLLMESESFQEALNKTVMGVAIRNVASVKVLKEIKIPLPPISIQSAIVAEIEGYQKIIDGAKAVVTNYKPKIDIDPAWEMVELGEISTKITDGTHKTPTYTNSGIPFLRVTDLTKSNDSKKFISVEEHTELIKRCNPEIGDVLYSKNGTIGVAKVIDWDFEFSIFVSLALIKPKHDVINSKYLECFLNSDAAFFQATARSKSGTVTNLHLIDIKTIKVPLPDIKTQRQIVAQIEKEQALVNANKQLIEIFEQKIKDRIAKVWGE